MSAKKIPASVFVSGIGNDVCGPFFDEAGNLHVLRQSIGTVLAIDSVGNPRTVVSTGGQPSCGVFSSDGLMYVADFAHAAVLAYTPDGQQEMVVSVYEDKPLKGPHGLALLDGDVFFTDSGAFGETGMHSPTGSLFVISSSPSGKILKPISLGNLCYPAGIAVTKDKKFMYEHHLFCSHLRLVLPLFAHFALSFFHSMTSRFSVRICAGPADMWQRQ